MGRWPTLSHRQKGALARPSQNEGTSVLMSSREAARPVLLIATKEIKLLRVNKQPVVPQASIGVSGFSMAVSNSSTSRPASLRR